MKRLKPPQYFLYTVCGILPQPHMFRLLLFRIGTGIYQKKSFKDRRSDLLKHLAIVDF